MITGKFTGGRTNHSFQAERHHIVKSPDSHAERAWRCLDDTEQLANQIHEVLYGSYLTLPLLRPPSRSLFGSGLYNTPMLSSVSSVDDPALSRPCTGRWSWDALRAPGISHESVQ